MSANKTIVVIGAGFYGIWCANRLARANNSYKVKLVSKSDYTYHTVSAIRVAVTNDPSGTVIPLTEVVDKTVEIVKDEVLLMKKGSVELKEKGELTYDVLIIATGSTWSVPIGNSHQWGDNYKEFFAKEHKKIEEAKHIVLIGGGYNNTELAGELHDRFSKQMKDGNKKITLVHSQDKLLADNGHFTDKLRKRVTQFYQKETAIDIILNTKAEFSDEDPTHLTIDGKTVKADLIYHSTGVRASVPPHEFEQFVNSQGFIRVQETFQCASVPNGNVFAIGDCCDFQLKGVVIHNTWLSTIIANVQSVLENPSTPQSSLKKSPRRNGLIPCIVSLGAHRGTGQVPVPILGAITLPEFICVQFKSKDLMASGAKKLFRE